MPSVENDPAKNNVETMPAEDPGQHPSPASHALLAGPGGEGVRALLEEAFE